ncbi:hypothetical protein [Mesorhizobium sp. B2-1-3A]|uniref:hypothetical protein n=1 Tax=Mesorhizobium sp. B2-1-3A TaxID=2589971 RepID=UPI0011288E29|nr:hypothetical protein [Mesorhizobium sp. B2-1-3A]TPM89841.1 hypothetical protein FJ977_35265 [Mesorhizobium sp. B2-1-3A]
MLILGLDIATTTGFAWYEPGSSLSSIKTGLIQAIGENAEEKAASLGDKLHAMFKEQKPDFVAIEEPLRNIKTFKKTIQTMYGPKVIQTVNPNQMLLYSLVGAAVVITSAYKRPWETIPPSTWRKFFFGKGFKPPVKLVEREGEDTVEEKLWKKAAIERCRHLKIDVKGGADAAEAVGIAMAGEACQRFKIARAA